MPECPEELKYLWFWFCELVKSNLTYSEINHWSQLTQRTLLAWEVDVLMSLNRIYWSTR